MNDVTVAPDFDSPNLVSPPDLAATPCFSAFHNASLHATE